MKMKKLAFTGNALLSVFLLFAVLVVLNLVSNELFFRVDLTENRIYSMSKSTKSMLKDLDDVVHVKVYFSSNLPHQLANIRKEVKDILDEYKAYSGGNISYDFVDPASDDELKQKLRFMGIPELRVNVIEKDKAELINVYLGMVVNYSDKQEVIPVVQNTVNLEYELTSSILKITSEVNRKVAIYCGALREKDDYKDFADELRKQYEVQFIDFENSPVIPDDVNTLIVAGPGEGSMNDSTLFALDQFIMKGGKVIFLIDKIDVDLERLGAKPVNSGIEEFLANLGLKVDSNLVLDGRSNIMASFRTNFGYFSSNYPFWVKINKDGFAPDSPIVSELEAVGFPWISSVSYIGSDNNEVVHLASSTEEAWTQSGSYQLSPQQRFMSLEKPSKYDLALLIKGTFNSYFKGKDLPETANSNDREKYIEESPETSVVLIGDSDFISRGFVGRAPGNMVFILNLVDWMTLGDKLIHIRSRANLDRPLELTSDSERILLKLIATLAVPLLLVIFGIIRWLMHSKAKKDHELYISRR